MPPHQGQAKRSQASQARGPSASFLTQLSSPSTWLRSQGDASEKPPHFCLDWFFWGSLLDIIGAAGYVGADAARGFFIANTQAADQLYMVFGAVFLCESWFFMISWRQATYNVTIWPHLATEFLNVMSCAMYFATSCMYQYEVLADSQDVTTIIFGNAVVFVEWLAVREEEGVRPSDQRDVRVSSNPVTPCCYPVLQAMLFSFDAMLYWYVWCVDNLELEEQLSNVDPEAAAAAGTFRRHTWLMFRPRSCKNVEMQEHVWNVIPSFVYIFASSVALYLQLSVFQGNMFGDPTYIYPSLPIPFNPTVNVSAAACYPNVAYAPFSPPCSNPVLFNSSCTLPPSNNSNATVCWADVNYTALSPGTGCGAPWVEAFCEQNASWAPAPRNGSRWIDGGTRECFRRGAYAPDDPCAGELWPATNVSASSCVYVEIIGVEYVPPPCNDPTLWFRTPEDAFFCLSAVSTEEVTTTTLGQLLSLRIAAQIYIIGDTLYLWDAIVVMYAWWIYAVDREREHREHVAKHCALKQEGHDSQLARDEAETDDEFAASPAVHDRSMRVALAQGGVRSPSDSGVELPVRRASIFDVKINPIASSLYQTSSPAYRAWSSAGARPGGVDGLSARASDAVRAEDSPTALMLPAATASPNRALLAPANRYDAPSPAHSTGGSHSSTLLQRLRAAKDDTFLRAMK